MQERQLSMAELRDVQHLARSLVVTGPALVDWFAPPLRVASPCVAATPPRPVHLRGDGGMPSSCWGNRSRVTGAL